MTLDELRALVAGGEGSSLEFKRSTATLPAAFQTLCAFLNCQGGSVVIGVRDDGKLVGQEVADRTLRDLAHQIRLLEPAVDVEVMRVPLDAKREALVLSVPGKFAGAPVTYDGRYYERIQSTTRRMPRERSSGLLLEQARRATPWESEAAEGLTLGDLDGETVRRVVREAVAMNRLPATALSEDLGILLDNLELRTDGRLCHAASALFGREFSAYPQCELQVARFRGVQKGEFLDQNLFRGHAFHLLEEGLMFCRRHLPLPGKVVPETPVRQDRPLVPPEALREILINALVHRDYTILGGAVSLAIYDDRVEVWSPGGLPPGMTTEILAGPHPSLPRNRRIAMVFHRAGMIERWGQGTLQVIQSCRVAGIPPPVFEVVGGFLVVTFRVPVGAMASGTAQVTAQVTAHVRTLLEAAREPKSSEELQAVLGLKSRGHFQRAHLDPLLGRGWLERTLPDRPRSRLQRYRTTPAGLAVLAGARVGA